LDRAVQAVLLGGLLGGLLGDLLGSRHERKRGPEQQRSCEAAKNHVETSIPGRSALTSSENL
jgi:hypothetical protein